MTQKQLLTHVLAFAELPHKGNAAAVQAARATCVIAWLHDMNWHPEADELKARLYSTKGLREAAREIDEDEARISDLEYIASLLNWMCEWGLETGEWQSTKGAALVEELWALITTLS